MGDWGLGIGDCALSPIPNPQSPIPNPHIMKLIFFMINKKNNLSKKKYILHLKNIYILSQEKKCHFQPKIFYHY